MPRKAIETREYLKLVRDVGAILKRHDPLALLEAGAPADEYESEAAAIIRRLRHCETVESCRDAVADVFEEQFGLSNRSAPMYMTLARDIFALRSERYAKLFP